MEPWGRQAILHNRPGSESAMWSRLGPRGGRPFYTTTHNTDGEQKKIENREALGQALEVRRSVGKKGSRWSQAVSWVACNGFGGGLYGVEEEQRYRRSTGVQVYMY